MDYNSCKVCGKKLKDDEVNICLNCGRSVCVDDYDDISGYCIDCLNDCPYEGC